MFYYDSTYILVLIGAILCMVASAKVNSTFKKYSGIRSASGLTGKEAAEKILIHNGIYDVSIQHVPGDLTDHYDPRHKVLRLSDSTYNSTSVAAIGVAAHECGHALQHATNYSPLTIRGALVPIANFGSQLAWPLIIIGIFLNGNTGTTIINAGILCFFVAVLFQLITLPVEFNASRRAVTEIGEIGILGSDELPYTKKVLKAAAMTYVASAAAGILQLLRLILIAKRNDD